MNQKKILLVNLPFERLYNKTKLAKMSHPVPPLSLAAIGGSLLGDSHKVKIFDFNLEENTLDKFKKTLLEFSPDFVGISFVTALFSEMKKITRVVKETNKKIIVVGGGAHCSSYPQKTMEESELDIIVFGEGDFAIKDIVAGKPLNEIKSIGFRKGRSIVINEQAEPIQNLDKLPYPAYELYDFKKYKISKTIARNFPVAWIETSRGCIYHCVYCNKNIFGTVFRTKSAERVVKEMIRLKKLGFKEVHFTDDAFTTDMKRASRICDLLIKNKVNLKWALVTGVRVNQVDYPLLVKMKKAGCYKLFFGIESGNQKVLNEIRKGITLVQVVNAVNWAKKAGLEVWGAFMIGLPGETEKSMQDTIDFAKKLPLDLAKLSILIPLPATPIFEEWSRKGYIKTTDWDKFSFYIAPTKIYDHPQLSWKKIMKYYNKFYREFYFRPTFILKRIIFSIRNGTLLDDIKVFLGTKWF
jgi:anaerobic magnesium-protoporphyrin IX monomethyl ester cyclase